MYVFCNVKKALLEIILRVFSMQVGNMVPKADYITGKVKMLGGNTIA
jgi:hypothetical protein